MQFVLTLVAPAHDGALLDEIEAKILAHLAHLPEYEIAETRILSPGEAYDILIDVKRSPKIASEVMPDFEALKHALGLALADYPIDWALQPVTARRKKLLLADMDSTIITVECIDELADFAGIKDKIARITDAAMRGELDFRDALLGRVALLKGLDGAALGRCYQERVRLTKGARTLVQTMENNGAYTALVSGGFTFFTERVAKAVGFSMHRSNILEIVGGTLTGQVIPPICDAATKLETLNALKHERGINSADILAVGDGANDIPMIEAAGLGVAFHAKEKTRAAANAAINHGTLEALLFFQGYKRSDFAS